MAGVSFDWPIRIYYEDTDAGGVVYHSQYLNFMERARTEWLRSLGFAHSHLKDELGLIFVVRSAHIQFKKPAKFDDVLIVQSRLQACKQCMLVFNQQTFRNSDHANDELLIDAEIEVVCVDALNFKPTRLPQNIKNALAVAL